MKDYKLRDLRASHTLEQLAIFQKKGKKKKFQTVPSLDSTQRRKRNRSGRTGNVAGDSLPASGPATLGCARSSQRAHVLGFSPPSWLFDIRCPPPQTNFAVSCRAQRKAHDDGKPTHMCRHGNTAPAPRAEIGPTEQEDRHNEPYSLPLPGWQIAYT